jgi:2-polyprenyl-6-methoxyphenol hydroxylase-like FAD-dependent oxidoreductase
MGVSSGAGISARAIIIGGGIGGVTAGIALQQAGIDVIVLERAEELQEVGSGLPLWTNALRALQKLGLAEAIETIGIPVTAGKISNWHGGILADLRSEDLLERLGTISTVVHRAELLATLLNAFDEEKVQLGATCVGFRQDSEHVYARLADGQEISADLLIGADGLHSTIRAQLFGAHKPRYAGYTCWRGVADIDGTGLETWAWGKGYQFGITPMTNDRAYWFAQRYTPEGMQDKACGRKCEVLELFNDWHDPIPGVIRATKEEHILRNDVYEQKHLRHWSRGRVTLLGDAAHAMTPNLGQGACQAIEDAVALAACLKTTSDVVSALKLYETLRIRRTNSIAQLASLIGRVVQLGNPLVSGARDEIVKRIPEHVLLKILMWILEYETPDLQPGDAQTPGRELQKRSIVQSETLEA